jgi:hypothetical protein
MIETLKNLSSFIHAKYFSDEKKWKFHTKEMHNLTFFSMGVFDETKSYHYNQKTDRLEISFRLTKDNDVITFSFYGTEKYLNLLNKKDLFKDIALFLEDAGAELLIEFSYYDKKEFVEDDSRYVPIGEKAKNVSQLIETLRTSFGHPSFYNYIISDFNMHRYQYVPILVDDAILIYNDKLRIARLQTIEEVHEFINKIKNETEEMKVLKDEIIDIVMKKDQSCYFDSHQSSFHIFNQRVPFDIKKVAGDKSETFRARFATGYVRDKEFSKIKDKILKKANQYITRNRLEAAISGGASDLMGKYLFEITGFHWNKFKFSRSIQFNLSEKDLKQKLKTVLKNEKQVLSEEAVAYFQMYNRGMKNRHKIISGVRFGDLFSFVSSSKIFVLTEDELFSKRITDFDWIKKSDKDLAKSLEENKDKIFEKTSV